MSIFKPPKNYEDLYSKISSLVLGEHGTLISPSLQSLLIQKISTPLQKDLISGVPEIHGEKTKPSVEHLLRNNGFTIYQGVLRVSRVNFIKFFITNLLMFGFSLLYLIVMPKVNLTPKINLIYGLTREMIYRQSREIQCDEFFNQIDTTFHNSKSLVLIQLARLELKKKSKKDNFKVVKYIPLFLLRSQNIPRLQLIKCLLQRFQFWISICRQLPCAVLLGPEIILDSSPLIEANRIKSVSTTVSQWGVQPYFFHKLERIPRNFFWYSNNSNLFTHIDSGTYESELSYLRLIKASRHFVWTESFGKLIKEIANKDYSVIDFILFYLPKVNLEKKLYDITIFDVTPMTNLPPGNYYSEKNCMKFINDILDLCNSDLNLGKIKNIALKPKRAYTKLHSRQYVNFVKNLSRNKSLTLVDSNFDIFELVKSSKFVVVIPFSTPALIAKRLGVKSCYYNPDPNYKFKKILDGVRVFGDIKELKHFYIEHQFNQK
jgi:polysaccharide biosynthesis PFTS motif protein